MNIRRLTVTATGLALAATGLVAAPAEAAGTISVRFADGRLSITGNDTANKIIVFRRSNGTIGVSADSAIVRSGVQATVTNTKVIVTDTRGGNDWVELQGALPGSTTYTRAGNDRVYGSDARDVVYGDVGTDVIWGNGGNDVLYGGDSSDEVKGGLGHDTLWAGAGNDALYGDPGNDTLRGEAGDDIYRYLPWPRDWDESSCCLGSDLLVEASAQGTDTISFGAPPARTFSLNSATTQPVSDTTSLRLSSVWSFEDVHGTSAADTLSGNALANRITSGGGDDVLTLGGGPDTVFYRAYDDDTLTDFAVADVIEIWSDTTVSGLGTSKVTLSDSDEAGSLTATNGHLFTADDFRVRPLTRQ